MPIVVECEECGRGYRVPDDRAGRELSCKQCGAAMQVPGPSRSRGRSRPVARKPQSRKKKSKNGSGPVLALVGGLLAVGLVIGLVVFLANRGGGGDEADTPEVGTDDWVTVTPPDSRVSARFPRTPVDESAHGGSVFVLPSDERSPGYRFVHRQRADDVSPSQHLRTQLEVVNGSLRTRAVSTPQLDRTVAFGPYLGRETLVEVNGFTERSRHLVSGEESVFLRFATPVGRYDEAEAMRFLDSLQVDGQPLPPASDALSPEMLAATQAQ